MDTRVFLCFLLFIINYIQAFKEGAPTSACLSRFPIHGGVQARQDDPPPYSIEVDKSFYNQGDTITISINSTNPQQQTLKGFILVAHRATPGFEDELVGTFQLLNPNDQLKYISCEGRNQSGVTHSKEINSTVTTEWEAPDKNVGPIVFGATVVESYSVFYINLKSPIIEPGPTNLSYPIPAGKGSVISPLTTRIDWDGCGEEKGCLLYPRYCTKDCYVAVSFKFLDETSVRFEMTTRTGTYMSVGFSDDKKMGNDQTITCTEYYGRASVQYGYNHQDKYNFRQKAVNMTDLEVKVEDGRLSCRFTRPVAMANWVAVKENPGSDVETDLGEKEFYLFLAWGDTYLSTDAINYHTEYPVISDQKISLIDVDIFRGSSVPHLIKVHASLMCLAWMAFAPLAIMTARYYRKGFKGKVVLDTKMWLIIHGMSSLLTITLTLGGMVAILVHLGGKITQSDSASSHARLGYSVFGILCILGVTSIYVPGPSSKKRPFFNFVHRSIGVVLFMLAAITMFDAYEMEVFSSEIRWFCKTSLIVWAGTCVTLTTSLEGYQYLMTKYRLRKIRSDQYDLDKISVRSLPLTQEERPDPSYVLYGIVTLFFACSVTAALCMSLLF